MANKEILWEKGEDFEQFDAKAYVEAYFKETIPCFETLISDFHDYFTKVKPSGGRHLDMGSGPCIHSMISASRLFPEIYLSDYSARNRQALQDWIEEKPGAHDWTPYMKLVANLEKSSVVEIEARVRSAIKGVIKCDVLQGDILPENTDLGQFDCITTASCMEGVCQTLDSYRQCVKHVYNKLADSGCLLMFFIVNDRPYPVGDKIFGALCIPSKDMIQALEDAGFKVIVTREELLSQTERDKYGDDIAEGFTTVFARK